MAMAAMMSVGAMGVNALASERIDENDISITSNVIDYSVYDEDMQYIPEHAAFMEQYN